MIVRSDIEDILKAHLKDEVLIAVLAQEISNLSHKEGAVTIKPELPIGTMIWLMYNGKVEGGLVSEIKLNITSRVENTGSWHTNLWSRWLNKARMKERKHPQHKLYICDQTVYVKFDRYISSNNTIHKRNNRWYYMDQEVFFSKEELLNSL